MEGSPAELLLLGRSALPAAGPASLGAAVSALVCGGVYEPVEPSGQSKD